MKKKSGQYDDFNPFKSAPKAERANIMARANNTALMVKVVSSEMDRAESGII